LLGELLLEQSCRFQIELSLGGYAHGFFIGRLCDLLLGLVRHFPVSLELLTEKSLHVLGVAQQAEERLASLLVFKHRAIDLLPRILRSANHLGRLPSKPQQCRWYRLDYHESAKMAS
jgi:hypothetical protein